MNAWLNVCASPSPSPASPAPGNRPRTTLRACLSASKVWLLVLLATDGLFILFAWLAYPAQFELLVISMILCSLVLAGAPLAYSYRKQVRSEEAFEAFLLEPDENNEQRLFAAVPTTQRSSVRELGVVLRTMRAAQNETNIRLAEHEQYIESWVHEIKSPLALLTLLLDNRSDEISPYVHRRLQHIHNAIQEDVEQILYFARLGAAHKDYLLEPVDLSAACREVVEEHQAILDEAGFSVEVGQSSTGSATGGRFSCHTRVVTDRKGLAFILGQLISNSVKYAGETADKARLRFTVTEDEGASVLTVDDNGLGVAPGDLAFIFDKGFTGARGSRLDHATGMGLFLVREMAHDLAIELDAQSQPGEGLAISLRFPK